MKRFFVHTVLFALAAFAGPARADVRLPAIFSDHMVLQRGVKVPVWGTAEAGDRVTVKVAGQQHAATADANGDWRVSLEPVEAADPVEMTVAGKNTITVKDVLVGEVWLCSGQSNMGFALKNATNGAAAVKAADRPTIRLFTVGRAHPDAPQADLTGKWEVCSPETVGGFSAVAYFFGAELQKELNGPVGLIQSSWGGTRAEAWIPRPTFDALKLPYEPAWTEEWLKPKPKPGAKRPPKSRPHGAPAGLFNGMIAPLAGYGMRGVVWYQGEANTAYPAEYRRVLGALVTSWRDAWASAGGVQGQLRSASATSETGGAKSEGTGTGVSASGSQTPRNFPFFVVQLPNFDSGTRDWVALRESQAAVARELPNVGLVVTIDVGTPRDIHPQNKLPVGQRLALAARKLAYGQDVVASGPVFRSMQVSGPTATLTFDHADGGLVSKTPLLDSFELAGADGKFVPAEAKVAGDTVVLTAVSVPTPQSVRYAWANNPKCGLFNGADLAAAPFEGQKD